jgi:D-alanyl-D-alanine carboxypeptidase (penicillin-binding protein 5/6)
MKNTHFSNCSGLFDKDGHYTTAHDVAIMSRELILHEKIKDYSTIWMDSIRGGEFELSNTNKLVYWYQGCTGLKTGYTSTSRYCLSATAERNGTEYIAVIMHSETPEIRNKEAEALLDYAFACCRLIELNDGSALPMIPVELGDKSHVALEYGGAQKALKPKGAEPEYEMELTERVAAPVKKGDRLGTVHVTISGERVAQCPIVAAEDVERIGFFGIFGRLAGSLVGL